MYCPTCGNELANEAQFCGRCGNQVNAASTAANPAQNQAQAHITTQQTAQQTSAPEQSVKQSFTYITSYLTFYLKGTVDVEADRIHLDTPNTILAFIPLGSQKRTLDIKHVVEVGNDFHISFLPLIIGLLLAPSALSGLATLSQVGAVGLLSIIIGLWGVLIILSAFSTTVTISLASGEVISLPIVIFEKAKADAIADALNKALLLRTRDTNFRVQTERSMDHTTRQTDRIVDAIYQSR